MLRTLPGSTEQRGPPRHLEGVTVYPHARPPPSRCDCRVSQSREQGEQFREVFVLTLSLLDHLASDLRMATVERTRQRGGGREGEPL